MHDDSALAHLEAQHSRYAAENYRHNEMLREILAKYKQLVVDYRELRTDYEGITQGKDRNPYVLVLIDGDTYDFNTELVSGKEDGGARAARLLQTSVQACLAGTPLQDHTVVARVYCNIAETSKTLSRSKIVGAEKRSLAPFAAGFTSAIEHFDFIDAGDAPNAAKDKVKEYYQLFGDSKQCKYTFLGAASEEDYVPLLELHRDTVTFVKQAPFDADYIRLRLKSLPLARGNGEISSRKYSSTSSTGLPHLDNRWESQSPPTTTAQAPAPHLSRKLPPFRPNPRHLHEASAKDGSSNPPATFFTVRPQNEGQVPVNRAGQRLDPSIPRPSADAWAAFTRRVQGAKLCNDFHLKGSCPRGDDCEFDHDEVDDNVLLVLRSLARSLPCPRKSACRDAGCVNGHICLKPGCHGCKLRPFLHGLDGRLDAWVAAEDEHSENGRDRSLSTSQDDAESSIGAGVPLRGLQARSYGTPWSSGRKIGNKALHKHGINENTADTLNDDDDGMNEDALSGWSSQPGGVKENGSHSGFRTKLTPYAPGGSKKHAPQVSNGSAANTSPWNAVRDRNTRVNGSSSGNSNHDEQAHAASNEENGPTQETAWDDANTDLISFNSGRNVKW